MLDDLAHLLGPLREGSSGHAAALLAVGSTRLLATVVNACVLAELKQDRDQEQTQRNQLKHKANRVSCFPTCA